jgi:predicted DNA-binding protein (UPF0251 family)
MAEELASYAAKKLKPGALPGQLAGAEDDIRQEAVLIALCWYTKYHSAAEGTTIREPWNAPKSLAIAMRYAKWRLLGKFRKSPPTVSIHDIPEAVLMLEHKVSTNPHMSEWSTHRMRIVASKGLVMALKAGTISHANAAVARLVYLEGMSAPDAGLQLGISRSAVYQHLKRVKRSLRPLIDEIEVPYLE